MKKNLFMPRIFLPILGSISLIIYGIHLALSMVTTGLSMGGLPVSDASAWSSCARSLGFFGIWPANDQPWCYRRPLYPIVNAFIFRILQEETWVLIFWNILFGGVLFLLWRQLEHHLGLIVSTLLVFFISLIWYRQASTQFMSEQLGITLGILATFWFWKYIETRKRNYGIMTISSFSIAIITRPGNIFLVLILVIFLIFDSKKGEKSHNVIYVVAAVLPILAIKFFALLTKAVGFMTAQNTWASLYGLTKNNSDWSSAYTDLSSSALTETEFWNNVRSATINNFSDNPFRTVSFVFENFLNLIANFFYKFLQVNIESYISLLVIILLLILFCFNLIQKFQDSSLNPFYIFSLIFIASELLMYSVILKSDPIRAMSTSIPLFVTVFFFVLLKGKKYGNNLDIIPNKLKTSILSATAGPIMMIGLMFIATSQALIINPTKLSDYRCLKSDEKVLLLKNLLLVNTASIEVISRRFWWQEYVASLPKGTLVQGLVLDPKVGLIHQNLFFKGRFFPDSGKLFLCFVEDAKYRELLEPISFNSAKM